LPSNDHTTTKRSGTTGGTSGSILNNGALI